MKLSDPRISPLKKYYHQWITTAGVTIIMIEVGLIRGWSSPYLARLTSDNSPLPLTSEQASWVASLFSPGRLIGAIVGSVSVSNLGSKCTVLLSVLPICGCWVLTVCANSAVWLYFARLFGGLGIGMTYSCLALYVGEIAVPEIRGAIMSAAMTGGCTIGVVVSSICGSSLSIHISAAIYMVPCILVMILFFCLPDSPHWLVNTQRYASAKRSIIWYQPSIDPNLELIVVRKLVATSNSDNFYEKMLKCIKPGPIRKAIVLVVVLFAMGQMVGLCSIGFYMERILIRSKVTLIKPSLLVIYANASGILAAIPAMYIVDKYGRKFSLTVSCVGVAFSQLYLGINSYLVDASVDVPSLQWLPIISIFLFIDFYYFGLLSIPNTILGEIFPSDVKSVAACIANLTGATWLFISVKSFQPLVDLIGVDWVFWMQGAFALLIIPHVYFFVPETRAKSLQEIQDEIMTRSTKKKCIIKTMPHAKESSSPLHFDSRLLGNPSFSDYELLCHAIKLGRQRVVYHLLDKSCCVYKPDSATLPLHLVLEKLSRVDGWTNVVLKLLYAATVVFEKFVGDENALDCVDGEESGYVSGKEIVNVNVVTKKSVVVSENDKAGKVAKNAKSPKSCVARKSYTGDLEVSSRKRTRKAACCLACCNPRIAGSKRFRKI